MRNPYVHQKNDNDTLSPVVPVRDVLSPCDRVTGDLQLLTLVPLAVECSASIPVLAVLDICKLHLTDRRDLGVAIALLSPEIGDQRLAGKW